MPPTKRIRLLLSTSSVVTVTKITIIIAFSYRAGIIVIGSSLDINYRFLISHLSLHYIKFTKIPNQLKGDSVGAS